MIMFRLRNALLPLIFVVAVPLVLVSGCKNGSGSVTYAQETGPAHFSFEYPSDYTVHTSDVSDTLIQLAFVDKTTMALDPSQQSWLKVDAFPADSATPDAATAFDDEASAIGVLTVDVRTIEQISTTVAGVQGTGVAIQYRLTDQGSPILVRLVYFSKNGIIYGIHVGSAPENAEVSKSLFDRLLKTLKILD